VRVGRSTPLAADAQAPVVAVDGATCEAVRPVTLSFVRSIVRRRHLRAQGLSDSALRTRLRRGVIFRVGFDRYAVEREAPSAAELLCEPGSGFALSHTAAALAWGLPAADDRPHVTVGNGSNRRWVPNGVVLHQSRRWHAEVHDGLAVTSLERTLADVARTVPIGESLPILDAGLRLGADRGEIAWLLAARQPGAVRARRALALADGRAESPLESRLRLLLVESGLPPDDLQHALAGEDGDAARVDIWYPGVVVEADGFSFHSAREPYRRDRRRAQLFASLGHLYLPFSWEDVMHHGGLVVSTVRRTLAAAA
jgi:hypothetical protein